MWGIKYHPKAEAELSKLDESVRRAVLKGILKVAQNPLPQNEGGYGKPLGTKAGTDLTNYLKIKFKKLGMRVVYKLIQDEKTKEMYILVIAARADNEVYIRAEKRI